MAAPRKPRSPPRSPTKTASAPRCGPGSSSKTSMFDWGFTLVLVTNGVLIGLMYSLIALGFVLVYKATDAINFAQGEFVMIAGFVVAVALGAYGAPLWLAVAVGLAAMISFGFGLERVVLRPLIGRPVVAVIMATIGLAAGLRGLGPILWGAETRALNLPISDEPFNCV